MLRRYHGKRSPQLGVTRTASTPVLATGGIPVGGLTLTETRVLGPSRVPSFPSRPTSSSSSPVLAPTPQNPPVVPKPNPIPSAQPSPNTNNSSGIGGASNGNVVGGASKPNSGLKPGGIAAIVISIIIFLAAIGFLLARKRFVNMRLKKRATWSTKFPSRQQEEGNMEKNMIPSQPYPIASQYAFQPPTSLQPPSMSYNNPINATPAAPSLQGTSARVQCTFIPNLPDELSITTGDTVTILQEFDDGWVLCSTPNGEQGMVPLECLNKSGGSFLGATSDWRNAQRASSLVGDGRY